MARNKSEQLCWNCQNARADRCQWIAKCKKVDGWKAELVAVKNSNDKQRISHTYLIKECPNFVRDEPRLTKTKYMEKLAKEAGITPRAMSARMGRQK